MVAPYSYEAKDTRGTTAGEMMVNDFETRKGGVDGKKPTPRRHHCHTHTHTQISKFLKKKKSPSPTKLYVFSFSTVFFFEIFSFQ